MPQGISINVGLNSLDPASYGTQFTPLEGCEYDARDMNDIALSNALPLKFAETHLLLGKDATSVNVINAIGNASLKLGKGDLLLFTFSGHGSQQLDPIFGDETEDCWDERIALYDRHLLDDELYALWGKFNDGVRIFFIVDSCHSGTMAQLPASAAAPPAPEVSEQEQDVEQVKAAEQATAPPLKPDEGFFTDNSGEPGEDSPRRLFRALPQATVNRHDAAFIEFYNSLRYLLPAKSKNAVTASVVQIAACQDFEKALDGTRNGVFTEKLREVWAEGAFQGTYQEFFEQIRAKTVPFRQNPNFFRVGVANAAFENQRPFTIPFP